MALTENINTGVAIKRAKLELTDKQKQVLKNLFVKLGKNTSAFIQHDSPDALQSALISLETIEEFYQLIERHSMQ